MKTYQSPSLQGTKRFVSLGTNLMVQAVAVQGILLKLFGKIAKS